MSSSYSSAPPIRQRYRKKVKKNVNPADHEEELRKVEGQSFLTDQETIKEDQAQQIPIQQQQDDQQQQQEQVQEQSSSPPQEIKRRGVQGYRRKVKERAKQEDGGNFEGSGENKGTGQNSENIT